MKLETVRRDVASGGMMEVASATIAPSAKIFDMFANDTYANKPLAIMRETVANAIDAHTAAGCPERPVEVILPTQLDPTCRIRDFGIGMSHAFVMGPFMAYTDGSTKDQSDDQIGGFGIGSKSPLSYVDAFTLRVVHEGILSVYTLFKNEVGIPCIGLQAQTTTDEANGVEISFPVQADDVTTFHEAAQNALQYFRPLPLVVNGTIHAPEYTYEGNGWAMRKTHGPLGVIMGGVRYPVTTHNLNYDLRFHDKLKPLLEYGLDLTLPIGACGIAMSREQLSYVPKTSESIKTALEGLVDDVVATFAHLFDNCDSEWEAMKLLAKETGLNGYSLSARAQLLLANAKYKGEKLESSFRLQASPWRGARAAQIIRRSRRRGQNTPKVQWVSPADLYSMSPGEIELIIIDDLPQTPKSKTPAKLREFLDEQPQTKEILIFRGEDEHQTQAILKALKGPKEYVLTSSMPEPAKAVGKIKTARPRVRMFRFDGGTDRYTQQKLTNLTPATSKTHTVSEIDYAQQPSAGIMVVMNSFDLPADFHTKMGSGLIGFSELVFVNQADALKIKDSFIDFEKEFNTRLAVELRQYPELAERLAISYNPDMKGRLRVFEQLNKVGFLLTDAQQRRPFGRLYGLYLQYIATLSDKQRRLAPFVNPALPKGVDPTKIATDLKKLQPEVVELLDYMNMDRPVARKILSKLI